MDGRAAAWVWDYKISDDETQPMYLDVGEPVCFRVQAVTFADAAGCRMAAPFHGSALEAVCPAALTDHRYAGGVPKATTSVADTRAMSIVVCAGVVVIVRVKVVVHTLLLFLCAWHAQV